MEGYAYSYPDSGDSSPRSREIDFENPPPSWEEQPPAPAPAPSPHKVKFMVSYGGKIQPRTHDNLLSYVGGETKILAVDRSVKFSSLLYKLSSLIAADDSAAASSSSIASFKYQLPGEDLDALISVTNDDDLEHMMHEYDRLYRASAKPARLRLFAFPAQTTGFGSASSEPGKLDRERFVEALNSVPVPDPLPPPPVVVGNNNNVDFLFGLDNKVPVHVMKPAHDPVHDPDHHMDARIQELNRLQISAQEQHQQQQPPAVYRPKSEDNLVAGGYAGDAYQKPPPTIPASAQMPPPGGYWQAASPAPVEQHQQQQHYQPTPPQQQQQPVYMIHTAPPGAVYHAPVGRPVGGQPTQGYYQMQRVSSDPIYREQQAVYSMAPAPGKMAGYSEGMGVPVRQMAGMAPENIGGYQLAYDNGSGRQVYYAAPPGVVSVTTPFQGDMRAASADGKVGPPKVTQTSSAV